MAAKKAGAKKAAAKPKAAVVAEAPQIQDEGAKRRGGRVAYETPAKHHTVLMRSGARVQNAEKAVKDAQEALYTKVVAALQDGVRPSAITRSTGMSHPVVHRMVQRAKDENLI